ncbi:hypothetical protein EON76_02310 [bacterium]|nr:MAG: hypothetical protein EON76_02310 [bacterium]
MLKSHEDGDTIIEVLFAITIFSLVAVGGLSIMNQGLGMAQRALEIGLVRQQIDTQADALRYLNHAYVADYGKRGQATTMWQRVIEDNAVTSAQEYSSMVNDRKCHVPTNRSFALNVQKLDTTPLISVTQATVDNMDTYSKIRYDNDVAISDGIWIQAVRSPVVDNQPGFYDFHIRACWNSPGQSVPLTLGTIVRLYEPRG